jgi:hypothetical protein
MDTGVEPLPSAASGPKPSSSNASAVMPADRLAQFEQEIRRLGVKGGNPEPERWLVILGVLGVIGGFGLAIFGLNLVIAASSSLDQGDGLAQVALGVGIAVVAAVLWARYSLTRYLRYWLIRQVYESRASTDRIVEAIERLR